MNAGAQTQMMINRGPRAESELRVLALLCQSGSDTRLRDRARELLTNLRWSEDAHQAVFALVMSFPAASWAALQDQVPARLTRRGFPDFNFEALFKPSGLSSSEAEA